ncbi:MAG TPA: 2-phospho-L-lactate transferase [Acidimicrobiales bacterium]
MIVTLAGGVGAARMLGGLVQVVPPSELVAVVNVGDDLVLHGLHISPDIDTVTYTLAGAINTETGWGLTDESWQARAMLDRYGGVSWFGLGDRDLGTHLYRTQRLSEGADLATVTDEIARAWGLELRIVPVTGDRVRTMVTLASDDHTDGVDGLGAAALPAGTEIEFQQYFVQRRHAVPVSAVRIDGADRARPTEGVLESLADADAVVIAPSNPIVSIEPVLAVSGVRDAVSARRDTVVAVSPIVAGAALKGPADRMLVELGHEPSVVGVARLYAAVAGTLVIDEADADRAGEVEAEGLRCVVTHTVMRTPDAAAALARTTLAAVDVELRP